MGYRNLVLQTGTGAGAIIWNSAVDDEDYAAIPFPSAIAPTGRHH